MWESERIIEPEPIMGEWDRGDPKYSMMVQQVVGKINTRPGGEQEMGSVSGCAPVVSLCNCSTIMFGTERMANRFKQCCHSWYRSSITR